MGTRLLFGLVGQATEYTLGKVTLTGNAAADHASLVTIAAEALGVPTPTNLGAARIFLRGGGVVRECDLSLLEKDDLLFFAFDGSSWRAPGEAAAATTSGAASSSAVESNDSFSGI